MADKLLIADDEPDIVDTLARCFASRGYEIMRASSGEEAVRQAGRAPDLILLDVNMPDLDGLEVCRRIRQHVACPIIFLTARVEESDKLRGFAAGGDDYVVKPFSLDELAECLPGGESPADRAEAEALRSALSAFLRTLPERQRQVFLARYFYALPLSDIAARFSMRENTVKTTLHRTRRRLRDYLEQEELL